MNTTLTTIGGRPVLRLDRRMTHPPDKVWKALTDPAELAHWFPAQVSFPEGLSIGAPMQFTFDGAGEPDVGEIIELTPPTVFVFRWGTDVFRCELVGEDTGCRLTFSHTFGGPDSVNDTASAPRNAAGWDACLDALVGRFTGEPVEFSMQEWFARAEQYVEAWGLGQGEVRDTDDGYLIRFERDLVQSVDDVWNALHDGHDGTPSAGDPPPIRLTHGYLEPGEITIVEPPRVLEYTWQHHATPAGHVRFELTAQEPIGCRLVLTQTIPTDLAAQRANALAAWQTHLELLFAALHGDIRCPWPTERTSELQQMYAERVSGQ